MSETAPSGDYGLCGWCGKTAVTRVITVAGRKNRKEAPVCEAHAVSFEQQGVKTLRVEMGEKMERERKRATWIRQNLPRKEE